jgi:hypothetical protein
MSGFKLITSEIFNVIKNKKSTVMVEAMIAIFVFLLLLGIVFTILVVGRDAWHIEDVNVELQQELRKAMVVMSEDLRQSSATVVFGVPPNGAWVNAITFCKPADVVGGYIIWGPSTEFSLGGLNSRQLLKKIGIDEEVIANNITSLQIRRRWISRDIIEVVLSADKTTVKGTQITRNINFQVKLRN